MSYEGDEEREIQRLWNELELPSGAWAELLDSRIVMQANATHLHDVPGRVFVRTVPEPFEAFSGRGIAIGPADRPRPDVAIALGEDIPEDVREHAKGAFGQPIPLPEPLGFPIPTVAFHRYPA
ncbi:hypothetical protein [Streptacidiphilus sp. EB129]|uniref:hypothetical protein n=1 Tax=Streptacidiphilus sp. EB129 TaxID=3156262 RepID=UPI003518CD9E